MSAIEVIATALGAGAAAGTKDAASAAVNDAYAGLKRLLKRRLGDHGCDEAARALDAEETDPGLWQARLGEALTEAGVATDEQTIMAAHRLLELIDPAGTAAGNYRVDVRGAKGVQIGDGNTQHNTFS